MLDMKTTEPGHATKMYEIICKEIKLLDLLQSYASHQMVLLFTIEPPIHIFDGVLAKVLESVEGNLARRISHCAIRKVPNESCAEMRTRLTCVSGRQVLGGTDIWTID